MHVWSFGARVFAWNAACARSHIAAVSSIAARRTDVRDIVKHGLTWELGHTVTLFVFAGPAILLGRAIPEHLARPLETAVGIMVVGLGLHLLWRLWRDRVHFHRHGHGDGSEHIHVHSHVNEENPASAKRALAPTWLPVAHAACRTNARDGRFSRPSCARNIAGRQCRVRNVLRSVVWHRVDDRDGRFVGCHRGTARSFSAMAHLGQSRLARLCRRDHCRNRHHDGLFDSIYRFLEVSELRLTL